MRRVASIGDIKIVFDKWLLYRQRCDIECDKYVCDKSQVSVCLSTVACVVLQTAVILHLFQGIYMWVIMLVCVLTDRQRRNNEMYAGEVVYDDDY